MKTNWEYIDDGSIFHGNIPLVMGTKLDVITVAVPEEKAQVLWEKICETVFALDKILNRYDPESEVSKHNISTSPLKEKMSSEFAEIVKVAEEYKKSTLGLFDILDAEGKLDFGGFGKGWALRLIEKILRENEVSCAFVDFGGSSILGIGTHPYGDSWKVGVINPFTENLIREVALVDKSMSSSGNTPTYSGHIRNPLTGALCESKELVTVVSSDPLEAEVLSTAFMVAGKQEREKIQKNFPNSEFLL